MKTMEVSIFLVAHLSALPKKKKKKKKQINAIHKGEFVVKCTAKIYLQL